MPDTLSSDNTMSVVGRQGIVRRRPSNPFFEHGPVDGIALRAPRDVNASARGKAKANQQGWVHAFALEPRAGQGGTKIDVAQRLALDHVHEGLTITVDEMRNGAASEGWEVGTRERAKEVTHEIERLRRMQSADDLAKPLPSQVGIGCRPTEVMRVPFREPNECDG